MSHDPGLLLTLTGGLTAAFGLGLVTERLRLSPIVGYLLAGIVVGPFTPGWAVHPRLAHELSEVGVILLMFGVGLQFHVRELWAVRRVAVPGALAQMAISATIGALVARGGGLAPAGAMVFGLAVSVASTVVLVRILGDRDVLHTRAGQLAVGWLLVQDLVTVLLLVLIPIVVSPTSGKDLLDTVASVGGTALQLVLLVALTWVFGRRVLPRLLSHVAATRCRELFTLSVLVLALGLAVAAAQLFGASLALGAFLAGTAVGQSEFASRAASEALPMRDAFAVLFFVAMGMLLNPARLAESAGMTMAALAVILLATPVVSLVLVLALRQPPAAAVLTGAALGQIGEFSFVISGLGRRLGLLPESALQALVAASIVSITLSPLWFRLAHPVSGWLARRAVQARISELEIDQRARLRDHAIVVGYGPVGRILTRLLAEHGVEFVVIELNHSTVRQLRSENKLALYGDASQAEILERAGIDEARSLLFTASGPSEPVVRAARALNPELLVLTRATYLGETQVLLGAGADAVVVAEAEVALGMTEQLLGQIGATSEQLDRTRDRVRRELGRPSPWDRNLP